MGEKANSDNGLGEFSARCFNGLCAKDLPQAWGMHDDVIFLFVFLVNFCFLVNKDELCNHYSDYVGDRA